MKYLMLLAAVLLNAKIVDKVVASVGNLAITTYDVQKAAKNYNVPSNVALNRLIDEKILESELKKRGIGVDEFEIQKELEKIAKRNSLTLFEFKNILEQRGELDTLKSELKKRLLKEKLFNEIIRGKLNITPEEIKNYYDNHKDEFATFDTIQVIKYSANNPSLLNRVKQNPLLKNPNLKAKQIVYSQDELPLNLLFLFNKTKEGEYTPIVNDANGYAMYYVARKDGKKILPFEKVKNLIANKLYAQKREEILKDYFAKIKNQADIKIYN
ncbi:MAG: hypothetical protein GXO62_02050 [Epsilonproteobacteria bacterium]|nr:hypothetical protein [Campylobacterota bacterium]